MKFLILLLSFFISFVVCAKKGPHIVLVIADDVGVSDVGYNNPIISTPNLNYLATQGIVLETYYTHPTCTPTRASLFTGKYAHNVQFGLAGPIMSESPWGLRSFERTIADELKKRNYRTNLIGKWHLGYAKKEYLPNSHGFDHFVGFYTGAVDSWTSSTIIRKGDITDWHREEKPELFPGVWHANQRIGAESLAAIRRYVYKYRDTHSLFLTISFGTAHSPLQPEPDFVTPPAPCSNITNLSRKNFCGMVAGMDKQIGDIVNLLRESNLWHNTIFIFTSDNGGQPHVGGLSAPFRGTKISAFEGGSRVPAFIYDVSGNYLGTQGYKYDKIMHVSDWFPTLLAMVDSNIGKKIASVPKLDGMDLSNALATNGASPRKEVQISIDEYADKFALRYENYKIIISSMRNEDGQWYTEYANRHHTYPSGSPFTDVIGEVFHDLIEYTSGKNAYWRQEIANGLRVRLNAWLGLSPAFNEAIPLKLKFKHSNGTERLQEFRTLIYDVKTDPYEKHNLANEKPEVVKELSSRVQAIIDNLPVPKNWMLVDYKGYQIGYDSENRNYTMSWLNDRVDVDKLELDNAIDETVKVINRLISRLLLAGLGILLFLVFFCYCLCCRCCRRRAPKIRLDTKKKQ